MMQVVTPIARESLVEAARVPPQSIEAEQSVLGGLLLDNSAWDRVSDVITEESFYRADHRTIFHHIVQLIENNRPADALTVADVAALDADDLFTRMLPPEAALGHWPGVVLPPAAAAAFVHGQAVGVADPPPSGLIRVHDDTGRMLGIGDVRMRGAAVRPVRILHADHPGPRVLPA